MKYYLIGFGICSCILLVAVFFLTPVKGVLFTMNYIVPDGSWNTWQIIQYKNPDCESLDDGLFAQNIEVPSSGFLCTSSSMYEGWHTRHDYLRKSDGSLEPIDEKYISGESAFSRDDSTTYFNGKALDSKGKCEWSGEQYFYGDSVSEKDITILNNPAFLKANPKCQRMAY